MFVLPNLRRSVWAAMLALAVCVLAGDHSRARETAAEDDSAKSAEPNQSELHRLTNDDLLKRAREIYDRADQDYRAAVRALAAAEVFLMEATEQALALAETNPRSPRPRDSAGKGQTTADKAEAAVDEAKAKQATAREHVKHVEARRELLDRVLTRLGACQSAADALLQALDEIKPLTIEIGLRVKDGSLTAEKFSSELSPDSLAKKRKDLATDHVKWKQTAVDVPKAQAAADDQLDEANKRLVAADAEVSRAVKALAQEHKRLETENAYGRKSPDVMLAELARLVEDGSALKGSYELALTRFNSAIAEGDKLRRALDAFEHPELDIPPITRAADVEVAAKSIEELTKFYSDKANAAEDLRAALSVVAKQGEEFEADATVSAEHLFKMSVIAELLRKAGVAEDKFPDGGQPTRVAAVVERVARHVVEVQTATERAKTELADLSARTAEAKHAADAAAKQLAHLKDSQAATTAALVWEEQFRGMTIERIAARFSEIRQELATKLHKLASDEAAYEKAAATVTEARAKLDELKDPLLRRAEEQGQAERLKIANELRAVAGLDVTDDNAQSNPTADTEADKKTERQTETEPNKQSELDQVADTLIEFQRLLAARVRVLDEREDKTKTLFAFLDSLETKAAAYNASLAEARQLTLQLSTAAVDLKKRVGRGDMTGDKVPAGVTDALRVEPRTKLDSDIARLVAALDQIGQEREKLLRPDADADALMAATKQLLDLVGRRLDLIAELKKLTAEYEREEKDRSPSDVKRLDQIAADRQAADGTVADWLLRIDPSEKAKSLQELLAAYYRELAEIEDRNGNLQKQEDKVKQLVELARGESDAVEKAMPLLDEIASRLQAVQEEELVVARARLKPDEADELLQAYQDKTGQWLPTPVPIVDAEKAEQVDKIAAMLFERFVQRRAAERWSHVLAARLSPIGIKAEAGAYQDKLALLKATAAANARRIAILTGVEPTAARGAGTRRVGGGEIGKTRTELTGARTDGLKAIGIKIAAILVAAFLLPRILLFTLRRAFGGDTGLVLSALTTFLKTGVWVIAFALVLSVLGFDVTAIVAGLGIGGLAIGLAAQPMIADMIAALVIFAEGKFKIGEVIKLGSNEPAKVVGLAWRSTQLRNTVGLVAHIPNRQVTEQPVQNLTKEGKIYDFLEVTVTTERDVNNVLAVIQQALDQCKYTTADHGVSVREFTQKGETKVVKYRFWWFVAEYEGRDKTREEVFRRISRSLDEEDLRETEVSLA